MERVFAKDRNALRAYATAFQRTKPHVNIGMEFQHAVVHEKNRKANPMYQVQSDMSTMEKPL